MATKNISIKKIITAKDEKIFEDHVNIMLGITAIQLALVDLLNTLELKPTKIFGYSIGEISCAYADKAITLEQALLCSYYVGQASKNKGKDNILVENLKKVIPNPKKMSEKWILSDRSFSAEYLVDSLSRVISFNKLVPKNVIVLEIAPQCLLQSLFKQVCDESTINLSLINRENKEIIDNKEVIPHLFETIGELYIYGYNSVIKNLYPVVNFPVSQGTRMISPLIKWKHDKKHHVPCWEDEIKKNSDVTYTRSFKIVTEDKFLNDHMIDGKFFVLIKYFFMVS